MYEVLFLSLSKFAYIFVLLGQTSLRQALYKFVEKTPEGFTETCMICIIRNHIAYFLLPGWRSLGQTILLKATLCLWRTISVIGNWIYIGYIVYICCQIRQASDNLHLLREPLKLSVLGFQLAYSFLLLSQSILGQALQIISVYQRSMHINNIGNSPVN